MIEDTMQVARVPHQGASVFHLDRVPTPQPTPGQVLIKVESAGVNFSDVKRRRGDPYPFETEFPYVPGGEVAGTVVALGPGVDGLPLGTRVFALAGPNGYGGYAQYALAYASAAIPIPDGLGYDEASILTVAGATAKIMLTHTARLQPGESLLVPAATGGVGSFAIQIAKQLGAGKIIAAVGHPNKAEVARNLGADEVVIYTEPTWPEQVQTLTGRRGVDVALESSGAQGLMETFRCLAPFGRLVVFGTGSGVSAHLDARTMDRWLYAPAANQSITGFNIGDWFLQHPAEAGSALLGLVQDALAGTFRLPRIQTLPLEQAQLAHDLLEERRTEGKLVLKPWEH